MLLFKLPVTLTGQLELLSVDDLTYGMHWRAFATDLLADWRESAYLVSFPTILAHVCTFY